MENCFLVLNFPSLSACSVLILKYSLTYLSSDSWRDSGGFAQGELIVELVTRDNICHNCLSNMKKSTCKIIVIWLEIVYVDGSVFCMLRAMLKILSVVASRMQYF